jgi:exopolysaccharide production protein ExoQ
MPPILSLILCTIFVMWLLTLDHKSSPDNSYALWLPTSWILLVAGKPLGAWFLSGPRAEDEMGSPLDRSFIIILIVLGLIILFRRRFAFFKAIKDNFWLMFLAVFMLLSTLWSDIFFTSLTRWIREILTALIMSFLILSENNPREAILSILRRTTYTLIPFSLLLIKYYPLYGVQYGRWSGELMWIGATTQKNGLGILCLIVIFFLSWSLIRRRQNRKLRTTRFQPIAELFLITLSLYLLKGPSIYAMSATSAVTLAIGVTAFFVLLLLNKSKIHPGANTISAIIVAIIIFGILTVFTSGETVGSLTSTVGRDSTLTGRTEIWQQYLPMAMQQPLLGHGFGGFWTAKIIDYQGVNEVHNGYLEVILHLGFIGLIFVSLFLLLSCRRARQIMEDDFYWASFWLCFLLMSVIHNTAESSIDSFSRVSTAILVFLYVASSSKIKDYGNLNTDHTIER